MSTRTPIPHAIADPVDYEAAEGLDQAPPVHVEITAADWRHDRARREWMMIGLVLSVLVALLAIVVAVFGRSPPAASPRPPVLPPRRQGARRAPAAEAAAPTLADAKGIAFEKFTKVDPTLPAVPAGAVKKFKVDVFQHVTQVSKDLAPTEVWSFAVNGVYHRGTGVSAADGRQRGRHGGLHARQRLEQGDGREGARTRWTSTRPRSTPASATPTSRPASRCTTASSPSTPASSCTTARPSRC